MRAQVQCCYVSVKLLCLCCLLCVCVCYVSVACCDCARVESALCVACPYTQAKVPGTETLSLSHSHSLSFSLHLSMFPSLCEDCLWIMQPKSVSDTLPFSISLSFSFSRSLSLESHWDTLRLRQQEQQYKTRQCRHRARQGQAWKKHLVKAAPGLGIHSLVAKPECTEALRPWHLGWSRFW
jgi:hypothetical protein